KSGAFGLKSLMELKGVVPRRGGGARRGVVRRVLDRDRGAPRLARGEAGVTNVTRNTIDVSRPKDRGCRRREYPRRLGGDHRCGSWAGHPPEADRDRGRKRDRRDVRGAS